MGNRGHTEDGLNNMRLRIWKWEVRNGKKHVMVQDQRLQQDEQRLGCKGKC